MTLVRAAMAAGWRAASGQNARFACAALLLCAAVLAGCVADAPLPSRRTPELRKSEEVFRTFCLRVARDEHPRDPDGLAFAGVCAGQGTGASTPRLSALLARRSALVTALDRLFAEDAEQDASRFGAGEISEFLAELLPFYDDLTLPKSTRALADVADKLLADDEPRARAVLATLARLSGHAGYRRQRDQLALLRPVLSYPRLDALSQQLLGFVGEGGPAHQTFLELLDALALELAEPSAPLSDKEADDSTLRAAAKLLLAEHESYARSDDPAAFYVRRDGSGAAVVEGAAGTAPSPFARANAADGALRGPDGRARGAGDALIHRYGDANRTLLAALLRDQKGVLERSEPGRPSVLEQLLHGLPALLGPQRQRSHGFTVSLADPGAQRAAVEGQYTFAGPDVEHAPLLDLVHALAQLLRYPETDRLLAALYQLMDEHESEATAPLYAALAIDRRADAHPSAQLMGAAGEAGGAHEFWDDMIEIGMRMAQRPGLFRDATEALATDEGAAQTRLMARFMRFRDDIGYRGGPLVLESDGRFGASEAARLNTPMSHTLGDPVRRVSGGDVGLNRSLFQRLISVIQGTNRIANCNKEGALLRAVDPTSETPLTFPDPTVRDKQCQGDILCETARTGVFTAIDLACPHDASASSAAFKRCEFVEQANGVEAYMRAMLGRTEIKLKSAQLNCLAEAGLAGDLGLTQESSSQIGGFTLRPSAESIARFMYAPRNSWLSDLFDPMPTAHGQSLTDYEPNLLFSLEVKDSETRVNDVPLSFLDASRGLVNAFDRHEQFEETPGGALARGGYLFADLLSVLHDHWDSRKQGECPRAAGELCAMLGLSGAACSAGCTQSRDPSRPFYARQSNLVSYEPLLIEAFAQERLGDLLALATRALARVQVTGEDGVRRDGVTVLGDFFERLLKPDAQLMAFGDERGYVATATCADPQFDVRARGGSCACPLGTRAANASDGSPCLAADGRVVPRGRVLPEATPLHLILDALKRFDAAFTSAEHQERLAGWRAARSALVDLFLSVSKTPAAEAPDDVLKARYRLQNPRARRVGMALVAFARERIAAQRKPELGPGALDRWALGLADRLASVLGHPISARVVDLFDALWDAREAGGPAHELANLNAYLLDPESSERFAGLSLALADGLELLDRDRALTPAIQFAALTVAEDAFSALDKLAQGPADPTSELGSAACALEVSRKVSDLSRGDPEPSTLSKLLRNAVQPIAALQGQSAAEVLFDAIADVNRVDPAQPSSVPHSAEDARAVFSQLRGFLSDEERGLERLYKVIAGRKVSR